MLPRALPRFSRLALGYPRVQEVYWCRQACKVVFSRWNSTDSGGPDSRDRHVIDEKREHLFGTIPNVLTVCRMASAPLIAYWIFQDDFGLATAGFVGAGILDFLDGFVARRFNQQSVLGSFLDPVADKVLVATLTLTLGYKALLSPWLVGLIVLRDIGLIGGGFLIRHRTKPPGVPFFSTTHNDSFRLTPTFMGKANMALQLFLITTCLTNLSLGFPSALSVDVLSWLTGVTTVWSGWEYFVGKGNVGVKFHNRKSIADMLRGDAKRDGDDRTKGTQ